MILGDAWKNLQEPLPVVLSIAGSDPSAGAGIQQDLKTITNLGCYAATVITAVTAQNTIGVQKVTPVDADTVEAQINAVFSDMRVAAVKLGMIPNVQIAKVIINSIKREQKRRILPVVCDPVMFSTSGTRLMDEDCIHFIANELFPLCSLITPNIPEYEYLQQISAGNVNMRAFLLKGGHGNGPEMTDTLFLTEENRQVSYSQQKIESTNLHGTGCTLSSAIASGLAKALSLENAVTNAKSYITKAIQDGKDLHLGHGNGPLWYKF
ncbi:MAG: bifunctional hydroxymethylpyrimidine kinase/phosphomethylpyrimidine kinase [Bacteroidales bacterium]|nr:bifunctional hydroxymethylpyrimidine kinase/phosphomethylpyrimidine kinase [Bacteroidales bacterium]